MSTTQTPPRAAEVTGRSRITGEVTHRRTFYLTDEEVAALRSKAAEEIAAANDPRASSANLVVQRAVRLYCGLPIPNGDSSGA